MELVSILRPLWERRRLVALGVLVAIAAGLLASKQASPATVSWDASGRVLVDTPDSQLVRPAPKAGETVAMRASLLADLAASDKVTAIIAREAGIPVDQLAVIGPAAEDLTPVPTPLVTQAAAVAQPVGAPYVVRVSSDIELPIIMVQANAPDPRHASLLVDAVARGLQSLLAPQDGSDGFTVELLAKPEPEPLAGASRQLMYAAAGTLMTFGLWCTAIIFAAGLAGRRREISPEQGGVDLRPRRAA